MSREVLARTRLLLVLFAGIGIVSWLFNDSGSPASPAALAAALLALWALLMFCPDSAVVKQAPSPEPGQELQIFASVQRQIEWWQGQLAHLRETYHNQIPDPQTVLDQVSSYPPEAFAADDDSDTVTVVVLRGPSGAFELELYVDLISNVFGDFRSDFELVPQVVRFREGSRPERTGYSWELQRINLGSHKDCTVNDVVQSTDGPSPGAAVFAAVLLGAVEVGPGRPLVVELPGYEVRSWQGSDAWAKVPYFVLQPRAGSLEGRLDSSYDTDRTPGYPVPVFV